MDITDIINTEFGVLITAMLAAYFVAAHTSLFNRFKGESHD